MIHNTVRAHAEEDRMTDALAMFQRFLKNKDEAEMYITGVAGTGKTTCLYELLDYCIKTNVPAVATAYTHQACRVLRNKLPKKAVIKTLHAYLKKRPTINDAALKIDHVENNAQVGAPEHIGILFIDEFSMVGERDFVSINDILYDEEGNIVTKVVYIGDPNQLPPVKDAKAVEPKGPFWIQLTTVHRQAQSNPLINTLLTINDYINDPKKSKPLEEHERFERNCDIVELYKKCNKSKVILAYTNAKVESLNAIIEGKTKPDLGDTVYTPTLRQTYTIDDIEDTAYAVQDFKNNVIEIGSKWRTVETLNEMPQVQFFHLEDEEGSKTVRAAVFGHATYLEYKKELARKAVAFNNLVKQQFKVANPADWARVNRGHELAIKRANAWRNYLAFKDCVICLDFGHAMTVHKSQGSTFENVYLDVEDMGLCADTDYQLYLKLLYVAISRASEKVFTN